MKAKRFYAFLLTLVTLLSLFGFHAFADDVAATKIETYVTLSRYGEFVTDKDDNAFVQLPVELDGKSSYTLDDVFVAAHDLYYADGADVGYASDEGKYGLYVVKLWGDESGNFGYQVNRGTENVLGLSHEVEDGDYIDVCIYQNSYPDTESYTRFDALTKTVYVGENVEFVLERSGYDEDWNTIYSPCEGAAITIDGKASEYVTDADGKTVLTFDTAGQYTVSATKTKTVDDKTVPDIAAPVCVVTVKELPDAVITVPSDVTLYVGLKGKLHFVDFTEMLPCVTVENAETTSYYFELDNKKTYNYRITGEDFVTYAGTFTKTENFVLDITDETLAADGKAKNQIDRDTSSNNGYNVADIYLNINPQGFLKLSAGDTYQIVNLRNWEAVNTVSANYFLEPDYHYAVIDEAGNACDVVTVDENGLLSAQNDGVAIVLVTYDALNVNFGSGASFYGAIWPENTGVFVVEVGAEDSGIDSGITLNEGKNNAELKLSGDVLDAEHDVIYFVGESGSYTFTPKTENVTVSVANPVVGETLTYNGFEAVDRNDDGSFTVPLKTGRNIVKLEKDGKAEYHIITAKQIAVTINGGEAVHAGDALSVVFDKLYHPVNKLAGVYNMAANAVYTDVSGYEGKVIGATAAQFNFANYAAAQNVSGILNEQNVWGAISYKKVADLVVPADYPYDTFTLSGGAIYVSGWGDSYGNHRFITYESGKAPNLNAACKLAYLGRLPDIQIPIIATTAELSSVTLDTTNVKTDYFVGEAFDTENLVVSANYADGTTQIATNYTISPKNLAADTDKVVITYRGMTAEIAVNVTVPKVTAIAVTTQPAKTSYKVGDTFDPTGMVVTATYENGATKVTTEYSYSPNRELKKSDSEITVTYIGDDKTDDLLPASVAVTVTASSEGSVTTGTITVYFTLYGDEKHGAPADKSDTHTMISNNLDLWLDKTAVKVEKGSYVIDAVTKALGIAGIPFENEGNYITSIKGLAEFDNGTLSGWMYTLNGKYPSLGVDEQKISNGDVIVFHYTDDYTKEKSSISYTPTTIVTSTPTYTVKFDTDGGSAVKSQTVEKKDVVIMPADPTKEGYTFEGWYTDKTFKKKYDFDTKVTADFTLYAKWTENEDEKVDEPEKPTFTPDTFGDVAEDDWFYDAVKYVCENGLMQGTGENFEPDVNLTRAMMVTILYRLENPSEKPDECKFDDVAPDAWYAEAVAWAAQNGIVNGMSETIFAPDDEITREQAAVIFYRYAKFKGYNVESVSDLASFEDKDEIEDWALDAVKWANSVSLINGMSETLISPKAPATRAQAATIFMRFCENIAK